MAEFPDIYKLNLFPSNEIKVFLETNFKKIEEKEILTSLLNLPISNFSAIINALKLNLIRLSDLKANINLYDLNELKTKILEPALIRENWLNFSPADYLKRKFIFDRDCSNESILHIDCKGIVDPSSEGNLGLGKEYLGLAKALELIPKFDARNRCLKYTYFSREKVFNSYSNEQEFIDDFNEKVLPKVLLDLDIPLNEDISSVFPSELNDIPTITDINVLARTIAKYKSLFGKFFPYLNNEKISSLLISSPLLLSKFESDTSFCSNFFDWSFPYRNTLNVLNELTMIMKEASEDEIDETSQSLVKIKEIRDREINTVVLNPSENLNRYLLFSDVVFMIDLDIGSLNEYDGKQFLLNKMSLLKRLVESLFSHSMNELKVSLL